MVCVLCCVQSEESLPQLTPEQQRQLELIDMMPLCKETESAADMTEWDNKSAEEREQILGENSDALGIPKLSCASFFLPLSLPLSPYLSVCLSVCQSL